MTPLKPRESDPSSVRAGSTAPFRTVIVLFLGLFIGVNINDWQSTLQEDPRNQELEFVEPTSFVEQKAEMGEKLLQSFVEQTKTELREKLLETTSDHETVRKTLGEIRSGLEAAKLALAAKDKDISSLKTQVTSLQAAEKANQAKISKLQEESQHLKETRAGSQPASEMITSAAMMPSKSSEAAELHFMAKSLLQGQKMFIYQRNHKTGLGSSLLSFFIYSLYLEETQQRVPVFDDSFADSYRKSPQLGLQGFLDFSFPVLNTEQDYNQSFMDMERVGLANFTDPEEWREQMWKNESYPILRIRQQKDPRFFLQVRNEAFSRYMKDSTPFFGRLSNRICDNVRFNAETLRGIQSRLEESSIPDFAKSQLQANPSSSSSLGPTVAFHVRRGDKVYDKRNHESKLFKEEQYVQKFLKGVPADMDLSSIQHCYVATDEYNVTHVLKESLRKHNLTCQFHSLVSPDQTKDTYKDHSGRKRPEDTLTLFTELYLLQSATYFVGSFNSNVGAFAALFRGCPRDDKGTPENKFHHFYGSYGVDRENWYVRK